MDDHTQMSWKEDIVIGQLHNSVDNAAMAVGKALTKPTDLFIQEALHMIETADRTVENALKSRGNIELKSRGNIEPISELQAQLSHEKERLNTLH